MIETAPDDTLIIPRPEGVLILNPTCVFRWHIVKPKFRKAKPPVLQQLWRERATRDPYWREVPTATGEAQKP